VKFPWATHLAVTANSKETALEIKELIRDFLKDRGLELSEEKTLITHIDDGFDFLGWNFRKYKGKLLIKPSDKSIDNISKKISDIVKKGNSWTQEALIKKLNPIITGWSNYHQTVVAKKVFSKLDNRVWNILWKWAKRRHPKKSKGWIARKYWHSDGNRKWIFSTETTKLKLFSSTGIVRQPYLKLDVNPFLNPEYFEKRKYRQGVRKLAGKFKEIWKIQKGKCYFCEQSLDIMEERDLHHLIPKSKRGNNSKYNQAYVHKHCHRQYHAING